MTALPTAALEQLRANLRGQLIAPGDAESEGARQVYNGMIDKRPALIARAVSMRRMS